MKDEKTHNFEDGWGHIPEEYRLGNFYRYGNIFHGDHCEFAEQNWIDIWPVGKNQNNEWRPRPWICYHWWHYRPGPPEGDRLKRGTQHQAIGRSRGGLTTKIVALVDALGNLVRFLLLPGQAHDMKGVAPLIKGVSFDALLADKAFDADWLLQDLDERGATAVIPPKTNRKIQRNYDAEVYKWRHLVENYFAKITEFRGIATRYDKTDCSYAACWNLVAALLASRWLSTGPRIHVSEQGKRV